MKKIIASVPVLCLAFINSCIAGDLPEVKKQHSFYEGFNEDSWRKLSVKKPLEESYKHNPILFDAESPESFAHLLVRTITTDRNEEDRKTALQYIMEKTFYKCGTPRQDFWDNSYQLNQDEEEEKISTLFVKTTPRNQQRILNSREMIRLKAKIEGFNDDNRQQILSYDNFEVDEVIKAASLCGTFCKKIIFQNEKEVYFEPIFSGMLVPGQSYDLKEFKVHTCLHGFIGAELDQLVFVPYGLDTEFENTFEVSGIYTDQYAKNKMSQGELSNIKNAYDRIDYLLATIKGYSGDNKRSLQEVLTGRQTSNIVKDGSVELFPGFPLEGALPVIGNGDNLEDFKPQSNQGYRFFVIGRPGDEKLSFDDSGFVIVHNLTDEFLDKPLRSMKNNPSEIDQESISHVVGDRAFDFSSYPGMSGGICLKTFVSKNSDEKMIRTAVPYAVVWGSERIFNDKGEIVDLKSIVNVIN